MCQWQLYYPIGSRSIAMGNTGYALADDESALFYNPAGLGFSNYRWNGGAITYFNEMTQFAIPGSYFGIVYQDDRIAKLGFAGYINHYDTHLYIDTLNNTENNWNYSTFAIAMGYCFYSNDIFDNSAGIAIKYYHDNMYGNPTSNIAFDAGYLLRIIKRIRLGIVLRNIGPNLIYHYNDSTIVKSPLSFTIATGIGYLDSFNKGNVKILDVVSEISVSRVMQNMYGSVMENNYDVYYLNSGVEIGLFKTFFFRFGYSPNLRYNTNQITLGTGISIFNHFDFDFFASYGRENIYQDNSFSTGYSLSFKRGLNWSGKDWKWWRN